jgi:hypothetical protein
LIILTKAFLDSALSMTDAPDAKTPGTVPSKPGVMTVMSKVVNLENLNSLDFCSWYEDTHIQEVQMTGGISKTQRYASLSFNRQKDGKSTLAQPQTVENQNCEYDFITVYHMPDLAFRETAAFRGLAGQSVPDDNLVDKIFKQAEFCTRFCEEVATSGESEKAAPFLVTVGARSIGVPPNHTISYIVDKLSPVIGKRKTTAYRIHEASVLSEFKRAYNKAMTDVILFEFYSEPDIHAIFDALREWEGLEIGFWELRRAYDGDERTPAPWNLT